MCLSVNKNIRNLLGTSACSSIKSYSIFVNCMNPSSARHVAGNAYLANSLRTRDNSELQVENVATEVTVTDTKNKSDVKRTDV